MKIALLTIWHEKNYGAELQTYATVKALKQLDYDVEVIDFRLSDDAKPSLPGRVMRIIGILSPVECKFRNFWNKYIPSSRRYRTPEDLRDNPPVADIYMVGSDQVWNPDITKKRAKSYFLDFGLEAVKRVSFASSFGVSEWKHTELYEDVQLLLKRFDFVTCREDIGVKLLKKNFNINAVSVVDPTLLFPVYPEFSMAISKPNLVYYPLSSDIELEILSKKVASVLGLNAINNNPVTRFLGRITWNRNSVQNWVKNIAESQFVITRSFHGLVFSLLYNKQFAMLKIRNGRNSRVENLLKKVGLEDRVYETSEELFNDKPWERMINYSNVNSRISAIRESSWQILKLMLENGR